MKFVKILIVTAVLCLIGNAPGYCDSMPSYDETVSLIKETMLSSTSDSRKESYNYIKFNGCKLSYNVLGTYPVGELYNIKYSNINFTSLNNKAAKLGHDYTAFIMLNFDDYIKSRGDFKELEIRTLVVNVSNDERARILLKAFLHLGELCGAQKSP